MIIRDVWGAIEYKGEGVTPFIAFHRQLDTENKIGNNTLIFTNKTEKDIIMEKEFTEMLGANFINTLTDEKKHGYHNHRIDKSFLKEEIIDFKQRFYVCGPPPFVEAVSKALTSLGAQADAVVFEK